MRFKKGKQFYRLPRSITQVKHVRVKDSKGWWRHLQNVPVGEPMPYHRGEPYFYRFIDGHIEIAPAPQKATYFTVVAIQQVEL